MDARDVGFTGLSSLSARLRLERPGPGLHEARAPPPVTPRSSQRMTSSPSKVPRRVDDGPPAGAAASIGRGRSCRGGRRGPPRGRPGRIGRTSGLRAAPVPRGGAAARGWRRPQPARPESRSDRARLHGGEILAPVFAAAAETATAVAAATERRLSPGPAVGCVRWVAHVETVRASGSAACAAAGSRINGDDRRKSTARCRQFFTKSSRRWCGRPGSVTVRNEHHHAIEQASRRWREGGDDSHGRTATF